MRRFVALVLVACTGRQSLPPPGDASSGDSTEADARGDVHVAREAWVGAYAGRVTRTVTITEPWSESRSPADAPIVIRVIPYQGFGGAPVIQFSGRPQQCQLTLLVFDNGTAVLMPAGGDCSWYCVGGCPPGNVYPGTDVTSSTLTLSLSGDRLTGRIEWRLHGYTEGIPGSTGRPQGFLAGTIVETFSAERTDAGF